MGMSSIYNINYAYLKANSNTNNFTSKTEFTSDIIKLDRDQSNFQVEDLRAEEMPLI